MKDFIFVSIINKFTLLTIKKRKLNIKLMCLNHYIKKFKLFPK
jgi:hypothetical protein